MALEFKLPELGEGIEEGSVTKFLVAVGDTVAADQPVIELETGKATVEVPSPVAGTIKSIAVAEGAEVKVGDLLMTIGSAPADAPPAPTPPPAEETREAPIPAPEKVERETVPSPAAKTPQPRQDKPSAPASPSVRKFAREIGIAISQVPGSGDNGRISVEDVKAYSKQINEGRSIGSTIPATPALPDFEKWGTVKRISMNSVRKMTVQHMTLCWSQIPHVTQFDRADITELDALRKKFAGKAEKAGGKLTMTAMLAKVVASALKVFPDFNASIDVAKNEIIYKDYINVGIAVDTERGLLVPVIRDSADKNMIELAKDISGMAAKARDGKVSPDMLQGGTFTITNLGGIGGTHFTPIVNHPEVAILGVGRAYMEPSFRDEICKPRLTLPLSLSYDHRLIDGASGARFLRWIVEAIEEPLLLSLEG